MNTWLSVLSVDDDPDVQQMVRTNLELAGYTLLAAEDGWGALRQLEQHEPSLVILDIGLSRLLDDLDGFQVLKRIRQTSDVPIIMLTSRGADDDKIHAFELGADDYLTKPFSARELLARVNAVLRRARPEITVDDHLQIGDLGIDFGARRVYVGERQIHLSPTEFNLLVTLARSANQVIPTQQLLRRVWGKGYDLEVLYVCVRRLRDRVEPDASKPRYILREASGYRLAT